MYFVFFFFLFDSNTNYGMFYLFEDTYNILFYRWTLEPLGGHGMLHNGYLDNVLLREILFVYELVSWLVQCILSIWFVKRIWIIEKYRSFVVF